MLKLSTKSQINLNTILPKCFYCTTASSTTIYGNNINITNVKNNNNEIRRPKPVWSPLAVTFNARPEKKINFIRGQSGLFNIPELISHEGFYLLKENVIHKSDELINEATGENRNRKIVHIFDELSDSLCKVADLAEFIRLAHPNINYTTAAENACISVSGVVEKLNTHRKLYKALSTVNDFGDTFNTTDVDKHVQQLFLFDFEQCGIHLPEKERKTVVYLNNCILQLGQKFMAGTVNPRSVSKNMLPESIRKYFMHDGDNILVSGLYADSSSSMAREAAYRLFLYPDHGQEIFLKDLLNSRYKLATICGFPTYSHRALKSSTVETPDIVNEFLNMLNNDLHYRAKADFDIMQRMKNEDTRMNIPLGPWDTPYYTSKYKKEWMKVATCEFTSYFSLGGCIDGLNNLMKSLYGIHWETEDLRPGESWSPDVYKLNVIHETEGLLGHIYCDLYERPGKPNQDCHFTIQGGKKLDNGTYQNPIVVVMLNLNPPRWNGPTLLSPAMVDNLFHEMGHAMHSMLARTEYQHVTGTRCSTDFAEVPSVLMEYFASDPRVLKTFARHFQTNEPMPEEMLMRLCASKNIFGASETQLQVFYSMLDQVYHSEPISDATSTTDILNDVQDKYYNLPYVTNTAWQLRFSHLVGYGAKYYSYLISRAIASWIWQTYFNEDPFNRIKGEKYRHECLSYGGCIPSRQLVSNFLQRDVTPSNLAKCLINEIDINNEKLNEISRKIEGRDNYVI